jgi:hypothetical protein
VRLRSLEALQEFLATSPAVLVPAYLPRALDVDLDDQVDAERLARPDERAHVLTSSWHVPLRWFVLVDPKEREVQLGSLAEPGDGAGDRAGAAGTRRRTGRTLVYRTPMSRARRRVARALDVLRRTVEDGVGHLPASRTWAAGWRSSTRARWSSSTTAGWCTCSTTSGWSRTCRPAT